MTQTEIHLDKEATIITFEKRIAKLQRMRQEVNHPEAKGIDYHISLTTPGDLSIFKGSSYDQTVDLFNSTYPYNKSFLDDSAHCQLLLLGCFIEEAPVVLGALLFQSVYRGHTKECAYVDAIAVNKYYKDFGIGRLLIEALKKETGDQPVVLSCPIDSDSNGFYEHMGFKRRAYEWVL